MKHIMFSDDERLCLYRTPVVEKSPNRIEIFKDREFNEPAIIINARFAKKGATKNDPPTLIDGHFDDFQLCPLNPKVPKE